MVFWYPNSFLASVIAILGSIVGVLGVLYFEDSVPLAIVLIIVGIALILLGRKISGDKAFKVWWKQVIDAGLEPRIAEDAQLALSVYKKNPETRTAKKLISLNPSAALVIAEYNNKK